MSIFSVDADKQDIEVLLGNVQQALADWEADKPMALDLSMMLGEAGKVGQKAHQLRSQWNIDSNAVIQSNRPGLGPWVIRFQQVVRRLTWWFMEPILQQIRSFQRNTAVAVSDLAQNQTQLLEELQVQANEIAALREQLAQLKK